MPPCRSPRVSPDDELFLSQPDLMSKALKTLDLQNINGKVVPSCCKKTEELTLPELRKCAGRIGSALRGELKVPKDFRDQLKPVYSLYEKIKEQIDRRAKVEETVRSPLDESNLISDCSDTLDWSLSTIQTQLTYSSSSASIATTCSDGLSDQNYYDSSDEALSPLDASNLISDCSDTLDWSLSTIQTQLTYSSSSASIATTCSDGLSDQNYYDSSDEALSQLDESILISDCSDTLDWSLSTIQTQLTYSSSSASIATTCSDGLSDQNYCDSSDEALSQLDESILISDWSDTLLDHSKDDPAEKRCLEYHSRDAPSAPTPTTVDFLLIALDCS